MANLTDMTYKRESVSFRGSALRRSHPVGGSAPRPAECAGCPARARAPRRRWRRSRRRHRECPLRTRPRRRPATAPTERAARPSTGSNPVILTIRCTYIRVSWTACETLERETLRVCLKAQDSGSQHVERRRWFQQLCAPVSTEHLRTRLHTNNDSTNAGGSAASLRGKPSPWKRRIGRVGSI